MPTERIAAIALDGRRLLLDFRWLGDRFGQLISLITADGQAQPLLESIEGSAADDWPFSPPLQSLSVQTLPGGRTVALLVGAAGQGHWSASIEADDNGPALVFDVACRHAQPPGWLGSRYRRLSAAATLIVVSADQVLDDGDTLVIQPATPLKGAGTSRWRFMLPLAPPQSAP